MAVTAPVTKLGRILCCDVYGRQECCGSLRNERCFSGAPKHSRLGCLPSKAFQQRQLEKGSHRCLRSRDWCVAARHGDSEGSAEPGPESPSDEDGPPVLSTDWRTFRAQLVAQEHWSEAHSDATSDSASDPDAFTPDRSVRMQGREWAHAIEEPEKGCLLLASTDLDDDHYFDRTVILVLDHSDEGTFGLILNRPMPFTFDRVPRLPLPFQERFGRERVYFGGPISQGKIFAVSGEPNAGGFEEVVPGVFFGEPAACWRLADLIAMGKAKASSFRFCVGYAGWGRGQLAHELQAGAWQLAACSADVITQPLNLEQTEETITRRSGVGLWEQIHELMGGKHAEIGRKSKSDRGIV